MSEGRCGLEFYSTGKKYICKEDVDKEFLFAKPPEKGDSVLISTAGAAFLVLCARLKKQSPVLYDEVVSNKARWVDVPVDVGTAVYDAMMAQVKFITQ
jgi:hypothetical protein